MAKEKKATPPEIKRRPILTPADASDGHAQHARLISGGEGITPEHEAENHPDLQKSVTVMVPRGFKLTRSDHTHVEVGAGIQEMPKWMAEHWWSKAQGVTVYDPKKAAKE